MGGSSKPFLHLLAEPLSNLQEGLIGKTHVVEILVNLKERKMRVATYMLNELWYASTSWNITQLLKRIKSVMYGRLLLKTI